MTLNDGSCWENLQLVCPSQLLSPELKINFGSCLIAQGKLVLTPQRAQSLEIQIQKLELVNPTASDYPLQKQTIPLEVVRNYPHLRAKTNYFLAIFRLRSQVCRAIHHFFQKQGFIQIHSPLITANDSEGTGELFGITSEQTKNKSTKLTVSGQLEAEALAQGLGKVYTFGPCFRAEKSHTTRHLAEFWMLEPEIAFISFKELLDLTEKLVKYLCKGVLKTNRLALEYLEKYQKKELISQLEKISQGKFPRLTYQRCLALLKKSPKKSFSQAEIHWGMDFQAEHEKYLCQYFNSPLFITDYPSDLKAFYMKNNSDGKTVASFDLIFPRIGEIVGGSLRENNYQTLEKKAQKRQLNLTQLAWYQELRRFGYAPSGGFGLGLERMLMLLTGTANIQDVIPFPRSFARLIG